MMKGRSRSSTWEPSGAPPDAEAEDKGGTLTSSESERSECSVASSEGTTAGRIAVPPSSRRGASPSDPARVPPRT